MLTETFTEDEFRRLNYLVPQAWASRDQDRYEVQRKRINAKRDKKL